MFYFWLLSIMETHEDDEEFNNLTCTFVRSIYSCSDNYFKFVVGKAFTLS